MTMPDPQTLAAILVLGLTSYAMRAGGFLAAGLLPRHGLLPRLLALAPGNLVIGFAAAGILEGGWPSLMGGLAALGAMLATEREWAALASGFGAAALAALI